jgi:hypothetical protein
LSQQQNSASIKVEQTTKSSKKQSRGSNKVELETNSNLFAVKHAEQAESMRALISTRMYYNLD